ncbi:multiple coagulation factor deficiency protein 2 homolog [Orbicella faveolata]|uniref:multiple coagulation factor deficiency protein 2 homolog n=1 Tax=Orbicella faveolata TaxID=48498 RepID=UPI0009E29B1B|nr:multiple coagulation factor deficiency protein 2 homolog [Orbicella faveolata]XP_020627724.1 multiple coagulation factor deficiency protein 2 homolog [Orbicella faveolata]
MVLLPDFINVCVLSLALFTSILTAEEPKSALHDAKVTHDRDHIKEHLKDEIDLTEDQMSDEDLMFHYFRLHDYDGNRKLDGLEIMHALSHYQNESGVTDKESTSEEENAKTVDQILSMDDLDSDGYIDYPEYVAANKKHDELTKTDSAPKPE